MANPDKKHGSTRSRLILRLLGPALLLFLLSQIENPQAIWSMLMHASFTLIALALILHVPAVHLKLERWLCLVHSLGPSWNRKSAYAAFLPSVYLGLATPGRIGDLLRIQYLKHELDIPYSQGLAVSVTDRLCDIYLLLLFLGLSVTVLGHFFTVDFSLWSLGILIALLALPILAITGRYLEPVFRSIYKRLGSGPEPSGFQLFLQAMRKQWGSALILSLLVTLAAFLINFVQAWLIASALGLDLDFLTVIALLSTTTLLSLIPVSISGVGIRELFLALIFPSLGYTAEQGIAFGLGIFAITYLPLLLAGFISWQYSPPPFKLDRA